ncbi:phenylalanyl-tRNA alpha subunit, putative [Ichthyophthirius multifiliis]|uniref:phenylalanine--tRNA ligase n=1 Tax=Ichthyophthirius multifiliis TaxID=5932 RepID=G0R014_ICHMU|nr:phenylalanyl-tRNA alpha subunit, putative [Ichthyophthirius multifiliis]EGR29197.1 phenylalanyl-tRNA alpha subunit, putative [Ichthyophthirius multifiliis]|eukprot:XP_004030433.1 phenylalanyl-tRNA alpha subunit, putative [Ichthyophthirius multifiliis]
MQEKDLETLILSELNTNNTILNSKAFSDLQNIPHQEIIGILTSLSSEEYVVLINQEQKQWVLSSEGEENVSLGTPEFRLYQGIPDQGINKDELGKNFDKNVFKFGFQNGMKKKWFLIQDGLVKKLTQNVIDEDSILLKKIKGNTDLETIPKEVLDNLKKRKIISLEIIKYFEVKKGINFQLKREKKETDLTYEMIKNNDFDKKQFKPHNWHSMGQIIETGNLHPLMKVRKQFREVLLEMGFEEMPTNQFVESSFWNFDALFQPQQHPARDAHDTFFIRDPSKAQNRDQEYWEKVKKVHENGGYGSIGYRYNWSYDEAKKNIFRTHTTTVSSKMLREIAKQKEFKPRKFFSIDRVFRNESLDATHLAEFHQIEGVIADRNVGLGELLAVIKEFFTKIGIRSLKFKPTYNPYTEPSMEIHGYHPILKKYIELGNSGVFRPEMLRPMGLPEDVQVLGWGLGLERPTMIQYSFENIRDLLGYGVDMKLLKENPICCFRD